MNRLSLLFLSALLAIIVSTACASHEDGDGGTPPSLGPGDCAHVCAPDGRSIIDCEERVVATCGAYMACSNATCVAGCEATAKEQSSVGCEYFAAKPSAFTETPGYLDVNCYAVMIADTWTAPVELNVEYGGKAISSSYFRIPRGRGKDIRYELLPEERLPAGELAVLFLAMQKYPLVGFPPPSFNYSPCPATVGAAIVGDVSVRGSGIGKMFHIRSSAPVIACDIYPYGGAASYVPSSSLLLPTSAWGTGSLAMGGYATTEDRLIEQGFLSYFQAQRHGRRVRQARVTRRWIDLHARPQQRRSLRHPPSAAPADPASRRHLRRDALPRPRRGGAREDAVANPRGGKWDEAHLRSAHARRADLARARAVEGVLGTCSFRREESGQGPSDLRRVDMTGAMTISTGEGDPEMVNVVPVGQYLSSYLFLTDPTYGNTNLVFVRGAIEGGYDDVELDCVGAIQGWTKIGSSGYELAYVDLVRKGVAQGSCDNGVHRASS